MNSVKKQITELFKESTVLTIAHRLNTIIHSDRIVILEKGKVVEFNSPAVLINVSDNIYFLTVKIVHLELWKISDQMVKRSLYLSILDFRIDDLRRVTENEIPENEK